MINDYVNYVAKIQVLFTNNTAGKTLVEQRTEDVKAEDLAINARQ